MTDRRRPMTQLRRALAQGGDRVAGRLKLRAQDIVVDATMLGSVGVGKTTLLASMYERFGHVIGDVDLDVIPRPETSRTLSSYIATLKELPTSIKVTAALPGTASVRHYRFAVGAKGRPAAFTLRFTDYPGNYMLPRDYHDRAAVEKALTASDVILVAIDTPALVEQGGRFHDLVNTPMVVTDEIKRLLSQDSEPRLVILTLLKSETYLSTPASTETLVDQVIARYQPLLDHLAGATVRPRVGCVLAAVQTIGPIRMYKMDVTDRNEPVFNFRSTTIGATYAPVDTDQPLRYLLRFVINKYRTSTRPAIRSVWDELNGVDWRLVKAVDDFAKGCKDSGGFAVLQDHPLLHPMLIPPSGRG